MTRAVSSIYTAFLDAPPAACVSAPFHDNSPPGGTDPPTTTSSDIISGSQPGVSSADAFNGGGGGGGTSDQGDGGSAGRARSLLVTGTYTLDTKTSLRHGSLLLHEALFDRKPSSSSPGEAGPSVNLHLHQTVAIPSGSILDIRLLSVSNTRVFPRGSKIAVATSTGGLSIYSLSASPQPSLDLVSTHQIADESTLLLSLALNPTNNLLLAATTNASTIILTKFTDDTFTTQVKVAEIDNAHNSLEAWTSVFSTGGNTLYSGGDDASFAVWDVTPVTIATSVTAEEEEEEDEGITVFRTYSDRRVHTAGVTAILPVTIFGTEFVFTGSYDQYIRVYSPTARRWLQGEVDLGGGVWRLEILPNDMCARQVDNTSNESEVVWILASCMHAGCCVLKAVFTKENDNTVEIIPVAVMQEHESMNYASACVWEDGVDGKRATFVSTSFYDKRCCCWRL
ncbi:hypothetical protein H072_161 [Dactylellina haptotyla CBS 200.50]|uniref:methylated diphthine methylhydrolase n=1 Tax=Dactylellina haptotyla (strain CBS 200.50) TaxID=1284197 RepID=S8ASP2_DACHA|nr:hypothetical protein H072_161 [Dactylellina haptotyla CBS 200.50]